MRVLSILAIALALGACSIGRVVDDSADRVDQTVDKAVEKVEASVERSKERLDQAVTGIRKETSDLILEAKEVYSSAVAQTAGEIDELRRRFREDLDALDARMRARIDQVQEGAHKLIQAGDTAVQQRIDQVFTELRRLSNDTIASVRDLIGPVLDMAKAIGRTADASSQGIEKIVQRIAAILEQFEDLLKEVKNLALKFQGKDEQGNKTGTDWGTILGTVGTALAGLLAFLRNREKAKEGDRWKPEELDERTKATLSGLLKSGDYDDEIAGIIGRLRALGSTLTDRPIDSKPPPVDSDGTSSPPQQQ